eukprot:SAG31_NODE_2247_length_6094_cov_6.426522_4_plen_258_part_00
MFGTGVGTAALCQFLGQRGEAGECDASSTFGFVLVISNFDHRIGFDNSILPFVLDGLRHILRAGKFIARCLARDSVEPAVASTEDEGLTVWVPKVATRMCTTLLADSDSSATEIVEPSEQIPQEYIDKLSSRLLTALCPSDCENNDGGSGTSWRSAIGLCGSLPVSDHFAILRHCLPVLAGILCRAFRLSCCRCSCALQRAGRSSFHILRNGRKSKTSGDIVVTRCLPCWCARSAEVRTSRHLEGAPVKCHFTLVFR